MYLGYILGYPQSLIDRAGVFQRGEPLACPEGSVLMKRAVRTLAAPSSPAPLRHGRENTHDREERYVNGLVEADSPSVGERPRGPNRRGFLGQVGTAATFAAG